ncbi:Lethal giant larvae (Lgl)-lik [Ophiocordyceps sinensis CO18]|uniref:Lethal giant larvae (Lgl)-lik n=1 Tax=Ophiocordyceps sinensis (strain Co18 / CGMCC 3.14243) TaxID=911162 RepID=T5AM30_OPHSC|nr:Lethal giant larvae (Lgl)-lik [Ophiocordyceps sinensis CO18]
MAGFLRGKQAGIQNDLSGSIRPELFTPDEHARYGINSQISCLGYDPTQSLLAIGTSESKFGGGKIFLFGQRRVQKVLEAPRATSFQAVQFSANRIVSLDTKNELGVWDPDTGSRMVIGYTHGAVVYSFKQNRPMQFLEYTLPPGAPGGNSGNSGNSGGVDTMRRPRLTHAVWHPSGTFLVTAHDDGSLVLWDPKEEKVITARTLSDMGVDKPAPNAAHPTSSEPFTKVAWCCKENCDDTGLLVAGGQSLATCPRSMTFIELGLTPTYATSSWQALADYFGGKRQLTLPLPQGAQVVDFLPIPRVSPHFAGAQDPIATISLLSSGELMTMSFPSGYPISPTNQLHPSIFFVHPFITKVSVSSLERPRWLSMMEKRDQGELLLKGGAEGARPRKRFEERTIIQAAHADSTIRIWDSGHDDDIENGQVLQVDMARALDRYEDVEITAMSMAGNTGEFVVGTRTGEAAVFRWGSNRFYGRDQAQRLDPNPKSLTDISSRAEPTLKEGLQPFVLYEMMQGPITAAQVSNVGFVAVGSELGFLTMMDLRGPRIIYQAPMTDFAKQEKRSSFLRGHHDSTSAGAQKEWPVVIEFGAMTLDEDKYSSICCFVGTNLGKVITFKLLPAADGSYSAQVAGVVAFDGKVISLSPIEASTGRAALVTGSIVAGLREGRQINGVVVAASGEGRGRGRACGGGVSGGGGGGRAGELGTVSHAAAQRADGKAQHDGRWDGEPAAAEPGVGG